MNFSDERWVKLYTRDTASWLALSWMARSVFMHLLRKCDRAGQVDLGRAGLRGLIGLIGGAEYREAIERAVRELADDGAIQLSTDETRITLPRFVEAQETRMSANARAKLARDRKAVTRRDGRVTPRDGDATTSAVTGRDGCVTRRDGCVTDRDEDPSSRGVTPASQGVTAASRNHGSRDSRLLNRTEQNRGEGEGARAPTPACAHARTHEDPSPVPQPDEELTEQETKTLEALAEGASIVPGRWDAGGAAWKRKALARELIARGLTPDDAFSLGDYLAQPEAAKTHKNKTFDANWFVFGTRDAPDQEWKRLEWVCRESKSLGASPAPPRSAPAPSKPKVVVSEAQRKANAQAAIDMVARMKAQKPEAPPGGVANEGLLDTIVDGVEQVADRLGDGAEALGSIIDSLVGGRR